MLISLERAATVFRTVRAVQDEVKASCLAPDQPDLSIEEFQRVIEQMTGLKIEKYLVPFEGEFLRGVMERYRDRAVIYVKKEMTEELIRFTTVKELCHVAIDAEPHWDPDGTNTIEELLFAAVIGNDGEVHEVAQSEFLAEVAAIELLYPFDFRCSDLKRLANSQVSMVKIASYHRIPQFIVSRSLAPSYHDPVTKVWDIIKREETA